jgi:N-acyl-L-homoserine lactone synthetase
MGGIGISPFLPTMDAWILESMLVMTNIFRGSRPVEKPASSESVRFSDCGTRFPNEKNRHEPAQGQTPLFAS